MREKEGVRVPPRPHLFQGKVVTLHSEIRNGFWVLFSFMGLLQA